MNFLCHGYQFTDRPWFLIGTALPDWLSVVDRRVRARPRGVRRLFANPDQRAVELAAGVLRHQRDDAWFHRNRAFVELNLDFTVAIRQRLPADHGFRPSFVGHILVELLLDWEIEQRLPGSLDRYYRTLEPIDLTLVRFFVERMVIGRGSVERLPQVISRFSSARFLYDYAQDAKLLFRINGVMQRVGLPALPESLCTWFPEARRQVHARYDELLTESLPATMVRG